MSVSKTLLIICMLALTLMLNACSGLTRSDKPASTTWWLEPYTGSPQSSTLEPAPTLSISVTVVPGLDTHRILTLSVQAEVNKYAGVRWADSLPELITSLVGRSLEESGRFEVVSNNSGSEGCGLELTLQEFFAILDSSGQTSGVQVAISGNYQCGSAKAIPIRLNASIPVHDDRMSVIVAAFQQAMDSVIKDLLTRIT
jgi:ABC-type uncharacterized transport system auxiliary subunit